MLSTSEMIGMLLFANMFNAKIIHNKRENRMGCNLWRQRPGVWRHWQQSLQAHQSWSCSKSDFVPGLFQASGMMFLNNLILKSCVSFQVCYLIPSWMCLASTACNLPSSRHLAAMARKNLPPSAHPPAVVTESTKWNTRCFQQSHWFTLLLCSSRPT
jgi:hypothetical protein